MGFLLATVGHRKFLAADGWVRRAARLVCRQCHYATHTSFQYLLNVKRMALTLTTSNTTIYLHNFLLSPERWRFCFFYRFASKLNWIGDENNESFVSSFIDGIVCGDLLLSMSRTTLPQFDPTMIIIIKEKKRFLRGKRVRTNLVFRWDAIVGRKHMQICRELSTAKYNTYHNSF